MIFLFLKKGYYFFDPSSILPLSVPSFTPAGAACAGTACSAHKSRSRTFLAIVRTREEGFQCQCLGSLGCAALPWSLAVRLGLLPARMARLARMAQLGWVR